MIYLINNKYNGYYNYGNMNERPIIAALVEKSIFINIANININKNVLMTTYLYITVYTS
jgi:hypothetical protein